MSLRRPPIVRLLLGVVLGTVLLLSATACGDSAEGQALQGIVRPEPLDVSGAVLPELSPDAAPEPFAMLPSAGRLMFVYFGYTNCPDVCPTTLANLRTAVSELPATDAARLDVVMVTVDPERDTADVFVPFLRYFAADAHALGTTDRTELERVQEKFGVTSSVQKVGDDVEVVHTGTSFIVTPDARVAVEWPFGTSSESMRSDLESLFARDDGPTV
jgi:protein SCO1/2